MDYKQTNYYVVYNIFSFLVLLNYAIKRQFLSVTIRLKPAVVTLLPAFVSLGFIASFKTTRTTLVLRKKGRVNVLFVTVYFKYFRNFPALRPIKLVSRPSRAVFLRYPSLVRQLKLRP